MRMLSSTSIRSFVDRPSSVGPERHHLHQADRARVRHGERIEGALDVDHGEHELRTVAQHRVLVRLAAHGAQDALGRLLDVVAEPQVRRLRAQAHLDARPHQRVPDDVVVLVVETGRFA